MTTPAQMLSDVRNQLYETDGDFWSDDELYAYMSRAQSDIARSVMINKSTYDTLSTSILNYPEDLLYLTSATYDGEPLEKITPDQYIQMYSEVPAPADPLYYIDMSDYMELIPAPAASGKPVKLYYISDPARITSSSATFAISPLYHELIYNYTLWRAINKDSDDSRAGMFLQLYQSGLSEARANQATFDYLDMTPMVRAVD